MIALVDVNFELNIDTLFGSNRVVEGRLQEIEAYLLKIDNKINTIIQTNKLILEKLDRLPGLVYEITITNTLSEHYSRIDSLYLLFRQGHNLTETDIHNASISYNYILEYEFRFSHLLEFIRISEFLIAIDTSLLEILVIKLNEAKVKFTQKEVELEEEVTRKINNFKILLESQFVLTHNFTEPLDYLNLHWEIQPNRTKMIRQWVGRHCHGHGEFQTCIEEFIDTTVDDTEWNEACRNHNLRLIEKYEDLKAFIQLYLFFKAINTIIFRRYLGQVLTNE
jgi:hypothetical protein